MHRLKKLCAKSSVTYNYSQSIPFTIKNDVLVDGYTDKVLLFLVFMDAGVLL